MKLELAGVGARHPAARALSAPALQNVTLRVDAGESLAVIGPSGAGKTTLLHVIAAALPPEHGRLSIDGQSPWALGATGLQSLRRRLFLAPQVPPLPPRQRIITAVLAARLPAQTLLASLRSLFYPSDIPAAFEALDRFDLGDKLFERVDRVSGGERQRIGLARALLSPASLWLVDEPLSALDPARAEQAIATLVAEASARGVTLIATLHQVNTALAHFPRIVGLRDGKVAFDLPTDQVTPDLLQELYAQREDELHGAAGPSNDATSSQAAPPAVMHCR